MTDKKQVKKAARKLQRTRTVKKNLCNSFWKKFWSIVCWPFKQIATIMRKIWTWVCGLDLIGVLNMALLVAIIVLFSMLIMDLIGCKTQEIVVVSEPIPVVTENKKLEKPVRAVLPISQNNTETVNVVPVQKSEVEIVKKQTAKQNKKLMGDVIIDSRGAGAILQKDYQVNGNLYLQNMRKYTLPCNVRINGNLFLRDVNMLQFCGEFVVTGNIYVSPRSSFGPLPKNARIGGHVVL